MHLKHAVGVPFEERGDTPVRDVMVPPVLVPASLELDDLLDTLRAGGLQIALVVDEFGNVDGLVTLEDLVEEIVGEVRDEHDEGEAAGAPRGRRQLVAARPAAPGRDPRRRRHRAPRGRRLRDPRRPDRRPARPDARRRRHRELRADDLDGVEQDVTLTVLAMDDLRVDRVRLAHTPLVQRRRTVVSATTAIAISAFLLVANAFFVGAEFALISARRTEIEPRADAGSRCARTALAAMENVSLMMAGAQLGITVCSLGLGYLGEPAIAHALEEPFEAVGVPEALVHPVAFAIALALIGFLHVVLGEMVPEEHRARRTRTARCSRSRRR